MFPLNTCQNSINLNKVLYCYLSHQKFKLNLHTLIFFFSQYSTMKFSLLINIITGMAVCTSIFNISPPIQASSDKYSCQEVNGIYGIYSRTERGDMRLMNFKRHVSQYWSIAQRCEVIARRFQRFSDNGILRFIGSGYVNQQPVLCAVIEKGQLCNSENIVVTLPPQTDPIEAGRKLMDTRGLADGRVILAEAAERTNDSSQVQTAGAAERTNDFSRLQTAGAAERTNGEARRSRRTNGEEGGVESSVNGHTYFDLQVLEQLVLQQENSDRLINNE